MTAPLAGLILAAGRSRRMGAPKLLLPVDGVPMVVHAARAARDAGLAPVVAVTGHRGGAVARTLAGLAVSVFTPDHALGMGHSLAAGVAVIARLAPEAPGLAVLLGDMPWIRAAHIAPLIAAFDGTRPVAPTFGGQPGHPVLWPRAWFPALGELSGDRGGRALLARADPWLVPMADNACHRDVDIPADITSGP